jgi:hypothetical protein
MKQFFLKLSLEWSLDNHMKKNSKNFSRYQFWLLIIRISNKNDL